MSCSRTAKSLVTQLNITAGVSHLQVSPLVTMTGDHAAMCVPDTQKGTRTPHIISKEVALILVFINCVDERFYSAVSA